MIFKYAYNLEDICPIYQYNIIMVNKLFWSAGKNTNLILNNPWKHDPLF